MRKQIALLSATLILIASVVVAGSAAAQAVCTPALDLHASQAVEMDGNTYIAIVNTSACTLDASIASYDGEGNRVDFNHHQIYPGDMVTYAIGTAYQVHAFWGHTAPDSLRYVNFNNLIVPDEFTLTDEPVAGFPPSNKAKYD